MKFTNTEVWGFKHALRGMRNPLNSWEKADTMFQVREEDVKEDVYADGFETPVIGPNDMNLAKRLIAGGTEHRKFLRQIFVSVDITAPLFWWKEFDTYKIGTVANSTSTMHTLASKPITLESFEIDDMDAEIAGRFDISTIVWICEQLRSEYVKSKDKRLWKELVRWLPEGWLQTRTVTMSYENLRIICKQRKAHKLTEWSQFIKWASSLPYANEFILEE